MMEITYFGEEICQGLIKSKGIQCSNKAYYLCNGKLLCGVHSKGKDRVELQKNPNAEEIKTELYKSYFEAAHYQATLNKSLGSLILTRMKMFGDMIPVKGYMMIFPNFKHQSRKDGIGMMSLSPKAIGPVTHGQPDLPDALNLENFHQANKVFSDEIDEYGEPNKKWFETQTQLYLDPIPHRHKTNATGKGTAKNVPLYSIWRSSKGIHKISYIESRQFYCHFYQKAVTNLDDYKRLKQMLLDGYNLQICGYDAFDMDLSLDGIEKAYLDPSKPFGHERVLVTLLLFDLVYKNSIYPWITHKCEEFWK